MPHDDRSLEVKAVAATFMSVACVAVILRCYVRGWLVKAFGWDDTAMVIAAACYVMFSGCMIGGGLYGTGRRFADLDRHQRVTAMEYWWICEIGYCFASIACKISVCLFLLRITVNRLHIWIIYVVMVFTCVSGLVLLFILLLQCRPLEYFWTRTAFDPSIKGKCVDTNIVIAMMFVYSIFAALCDFTVGILPIFIVRGLHMRTKAKMAVVGILSMACIASSAVIVRFPFIKTLRDPDFLYATVELAIWSNIEAGLGITAGSLATLRPLVRHWLGSTAGQSYNASPFPARTGSRLAGGTSRNHPPFPLVSLDDSIQGHLRPDKLAVTVTTVHTRRDLEDQWHNSSSLNSSEERLTTQWQRGGKPSDAMELNIRQEFAVTQTAANVKSHRVMEHA